MKLGRSLAVATCGILAALVAAPRSPAGDGAVVPQSAGESSAPAKHSSVAKGPAAFEPLARWRAAVLAGDKTALAALYSSTPPAETKTSQGDSHDPNAE